MSEAIYLPEELLGHETQEQALLSLIEQEALPQTLLLHGPRGIGKASFALQLAGYMLGGAAADSAGLFGPKSLAVDVDSPIMRRVLGGSHGDFLFIEPELSGQNQTPIIKVDAARQAAEFLSKTAAEADWRVVMVDGAEALNANAANALLKVVEEPPLNALMVLVTHQPGRLLPTLRSRCRKMAFRAPEADSFDRILQRQLPELSDAERQSLYVLSAGSPGQALALNERDAPALYAQMLSLFASYPSLDMSAASALIESAQRSVKTGGFPLWCELWLCLLLRLNLASAGALENAVSADESAILAKAVQGAAPNHWGRLYEQSSELIGRAHGLHLDVKAIIPSLIHMAFQQLELAA